METKKAKERTVKRAGIYNINGKEYVGVTTVLEVLAKNALIGWASRETAKIALEKCRASDEVSLEEVLSEFHSIKRKAGERGKTVHSLFEAYSRGNIPDIASLPDTIRPYAEGIDTFFKEYEPKWLFTEHIVHSDKYGFAGKVDNIIQTRNATWLLDLKTGGVYDEAHIQLEAYRVAVEEMKLAKIDKMMVLRVPGDGTFSLIETKGDFSIFLHLKSVWEWIQKKEG